MHTPLLTPSPTPAAPPSTHPDWEGAAPSLAEYAALRRMARLHEELIPLILDEGGIAVLVDRLAAIVDNPVAVADQLFHLITSSPRGEHGDRHRREAIAHGGTPRRVLDDPDVGGHFRRVAEERRPILFPAFPHHGMDQRRLMAPILAGGEVIGYLTVLEEQPFADWLPAFLPQVTAILALELMKRRVVLETELHLMTDFLGDLLFGRSTDHETIVARAGFLGVDLFRPWLLLLVEADDIAALCRATRLANPVAALQQLFAIIRRRIRQRLPGGIVVVQSQSIVILYPAASGGESPDESARELARLLRQDVVRTLPDASVSVAVGGICSGIEAFPVRYAEARRALDVLHSLHRADQTVALADLGLYGILFRREDQEELLRFARRLIDPLLTHDARRQTDLVGTLEAYLAEQGALRRTARRLDIHLNTLRGRLARISQLCNVDLKDAATCLNLQLAIEIGRLANEVPTPRRHGRSPAAG